MEIEKMQQLEKDIREIKTALIGNSEMNQRGIVHMIKDHDDYIEKDKTFKSKSVGFIAGIQALMGAIAAYFAYR